MSIRPPKGNYDWSEEQQLEWIRQLQAEVLGEDYDAGSEPEGGAPQSELVGLGVGADGKR